MHKFSMAMNITFFNKVTLYAMTLPKWLKSPSPQPGPFEQQWKRVEWDVSQKVESKEKNETKRRVWTSCNLWRCKVEPGLNPLCS
jgi:hypothetical protein